MDQAASHSPPPDHTATGPDAAASGSPGAPGNDAADTGTDAAPSPPRPTTTRPDHLRRPTEGRMVAGVAAGIAECFDLDPTVVRMGFVALGVLGGLAFPLYLAGWLLLPAEGADLSVGEELLAQARAS